MYILTFNETITPLPEGPILKLGRSTGSDIVCDDKSASRIHAELKVERGQLSFRDLESTNGSKVNGRAASPLAWQVLGEGDTIQIGAWIAAVGKTDEAYVEKEDEVKIPRPTIDPAGPAHHFEATRARTIPPELLGDKK